MSRKDKSLEIAKHVSSGQVLGGMGVESNCFDGYRLSFWSDEDFLEFDGDDGCTTL